MYKSIDLKEKASDFEKKVAEYWQDKQIPDKSITNREGAQKFVFFEGPPRQMESPAFIMLWREQLKTFFVAIRL